MTASAPVLAVVQARMGSTRLPGKVLAPVAGTTVLGLLLARLARAERVDAVVVATTVEPADDAIEAAAAAHGASVVRGSVDDVLGRFLLALDRVPAAIVVRLTADCPLTDPTLVDGAVAALEHGADVVTNGTPGYLRGFDVEVCTATALREAGREAAPGPDRIHVTPWLYAHPDRFRIVEQAWPEDHGHLRLTVDTPEDLEVVQAVCARLDDPVTASWRDAAAVLEADPELAARNAHVRQKAIEEG